MEKIKLLKFHFIVCAIAVFIGGILLIFNQGALSAQANIPDDSNAVLLKARQFIPPVGGEMSAVKESRHAIIQFEGQPQQEILDALADKAVDILEYIPRHAVMAHIPANTEIASIPGIRWVGALQPSDKISRLLNLSLDKGFILVDVFPNITWEEAREIINTAGGEIMENPHLLPQTFLVHADQDVVTALSHADEVSWIWAASDAVIEGLPVHRCPGAMTAFGPIAAYVAHDDGWDGPGQGSAHDLTYHFENGTPDITGNLEEIEVERGLNEWTKYAAITWTETGTADLSRSMDILWGAGAHGDGYPFDGPGGVLAHCFYPSPPNPEPIGGDMHFDEDETWRIGSNFDMFSVALHEAGHGLGLAHSSDPGAVMYPYYQMVTGLAQDDIDGIRSIYASAGNDPVADITANGSDGPVTISTTDTLLVNVELDAGAYTGDDADWWVLADTPFGWYYYHLSSGWQPGQVVTHQGPLFDLSPYQVMNMTLPPGSYAFYFGVDMIMNGSLDMGQIYYDSVEVEITP